MEESKQSSKIDVRRRYRPHVLVFIAGFSLMVIELVASRIVAPYLGSSLYTWTGVIGVVLLGIAIGNYAGGLLAEKGVGWRGIGFIFVAAGLAAVISFFISLPLAKSIKLFEPPLPLAIMFFSFLEFFPISLFLSTITPIVISLSLDSLKKTGTTVGRIYAISTAASIIGTFATGFVLIPFLGVKTIVLGVAALLLLTGLLTARDDKLIGGGPVLVMVLLLWASLLVPSYCFTETAYYCVRIKSQYSEDGVENRILVLDKLVHSHVYADPARLGYDYETAYAIAAEYAGRRAEPRPLRVLFLGGGGYVMPRFLEETRPEAELTVVEIDPGVSDVAVRYFGVNPEGRIRTVNEDARLFLTDHAAGETYDLIYGDAYNDISIPFHLTTREFFALVGEHLAPRGVYALNVIDAYGHGRVLSSFLQTAAEVFPYLEVATLNPGWQDNPWRTTYVLLASNEELDRGDWLAAAQTAYNRDIASPAPVPIEMAGHLMSEQDKGAFLAGHRGLVLTDDYVPIDSLVTPLFRDIY